MRFIDEMGWCVVLSFITSRALMGCPQPQPPTPDSGDAALLGDATPAVAVCENLDFVGCPEGRDPKCAEVIAHAIDAGLTRVDVPCLAHASTRAAVRACGFAGCP